VVVFFMCIAICPMSYVLCFYQVVANPDGMSFAKDNTKPIGGEKRETKVISNALMTSDGILEDYT